MQHTENEKDGSKFKLTWEQTSCNVIVTVHTGTAIDTRPTQAFDITFTNNSVNIAIPGNQRQVIEFYDDIIKDRSRVQLKKDRIILLVVKQNQELLWPTLEKKTVSKEAADGCLNKPMDVDGSLAEDAVGEVNKEAIQRTTDEFNLDLVKKEEEPVYILEQLKHDFIERDSLLTLYVYVKDLDKDAVKIIFTKQGFLLKFQTSDAKFLQLYKDTTKETVFTWPVTTKHEIDPEKCKYSVGSAKIEIRLLKKSNNIWSSLEAPVKKDANNAARSESWMPITKTPPPSATTTPGKISDCSKPSKVIFDEMADIEVNNERISSKAIPIPGYSNNHEGTEIGAGSPFGDNLKIRTNSAQDRNKPTAKVHPLSNQALESGIVVPPGFSGLVNLGNTCFMNCVLQVLANTREFKDYFLDGRFLNEINEDNPLGMRGQLAATFGHLLQSLWSCKKACWEPRKLKDLISKKNPQFFGYAQHDAHEFLAFLLDGLHEDLNRIRKKPYTQTVDSDGRPDEVVAAEAWAQYKQRNDSVVVDLFQGQYKSKLVCPRCGKVSITFDPFLYLSVPLPKKSKIIPVTFMWKESYKKPVRYQIQVNQDSSVEKLKEELSIRTNVPPCDIRVFEAYKGLIRKSFPKGSSLANIDQKDVIIACEILSEEVAGEDVVEIPVMQRTMFPSDFPSRCAFCHKNCSDGNSLKRCTKCYKVGYCDQNCQRSHWTIHKSQCNVSPDPIGCPFILSLPASRVTYGNLIKHMEGFSRYSVDIFQPPVKSEGCTKSSSSAPVSNLNSSLSQSCSSLNSLDSLSSASSTCTLTGDQSDPQTQLEGGDESCEGISPNINGSDTQVAEDTDNLCRSSMDSGYESIQSKSSEKVVPMSHVMGVQVAEMDRDRTTPTFYIKPVNPEGLGIKEAERFEDKGDQPIDLSKSKILSMDWRNNSKQPSYVLVQSKELEAEEVDNLNNMAASGINKPSLKQCLELFTEPEILNPEEAWYCPSCKKHVEASKQMAIWKLPHTLVIQLKRFSFQNFLMRSKIKKHIDFPTRGLDMSPFCHGLKPNEPPPIYDLYGVANHHGLLIGGHYTSYVRLAGDVISGTSEVGWRLCDDSRVSPISNERSVVTADAYLLFYCHRGSQAVIGIPQGIATPASPNLYQESAQASTSHAAMDTDVTYQNLDDERNGNTIQTPQNTNMKIKESVNNKLLRELNRGEASDRCSYESMNRENIHRAKATVIEDAGSISSRHFHTDHQNRTDVRCDAVEMEAMEKCDLEKDFIDNCDHEIMTNSADFDYIDQDYDPEERSLVIDTGPDLGYTDMEAVD